MALIEANQLKKSFGDLHAVQGISLQIEKGQIFGLLGPNGAGKSTTLSMIVGLSKPDSGTVTLDGSPVHPDALDIKSKIGFVPQELALLEDLSALDNLQFFGGLYGLGKTQLTARIAEVLEIVGLTDRSKSIVKEYSGGMKRRLNLAVALLQNPLLLVLDEPTVGVDPQSRNAIFDTLLRLREEGLTILYTTHYMEEVERLCDDIAIVDHGRIIAQGDRHKLGAMLPDQDQITIRFSTGDREKVGAALSPYSAELADDFARFSVRELVTDLPIVLSALHTHEVPILSLESKTASLEEVFLHLTGRTLRD